MKKILIFIPLFFCYSLANANVIINEIMTANVSATTTMAGESSDWIELYNSGSNIVDLSGYHLSDTDEELEKWAFPAVSIAPGEYLLLWASSLDVIQDGEIHTNFKLKSSGEAVFLTNNNGELIDQSPIVNLNPDISIGRTPSDLSNWYHYSQSTPNAANTTLAYQGQVGEASLSYEEGFYDDAIVVAIYPEEANDAIHYTLDGSPPTIESPIYESPLTIEDNTVIRTIAFRADYLPSNIGTYTYLFDTDLHLGVVSLATRPASLFGGGIYDTSNGNSEQPIHMTYFKTLDSIAFKIDMGVKMHAMPDNRPQKSMRLYARAAYGQKEINYPIFDEKEINRFKTIILRNGGNDAIQSHKTHIRDVFAQDLYRQQDPSYGMSAFETVHVYINGQYWGIYNLRERQDEHYMQDNFGYTDQEVDFLEYDYQEPGVKKTISGDWEDWEALSAFLIDEDISQEDNYAIVEDWMDIDNFIDYQLYEIFIGNQDWINNNTKFWRPKAQDGKWKWIMWDTDYALGTQKDYPVGSPNFNFLNMAIYWGGWGNDDWTWMLRNLLENETFKYRFSIRFLDLLNTSFENEYTQQQIQNLVDVLSPDIEKQFNRWGSNMMNWEEDVERIRNFVEERVDYNRLHMSNEFDWSQELVNLQVDVSDTDAGNIQVNTLFIDENTLGWQTQPYPWDGEYYTNIEVRLEAIAKPGYQFVEWQGDFTSTDPILTFTMSENTVVDAIFEPVAIEEAPELLINELMATNDDVFPDENGEFEDWIEIYNPTMEAVTLSGLYLSDDPEEPTKWQIPMNGEQNVTIPADGYFSFYADDAVEEGYLHTNFKLKQSGETIGLYYWNAVLEEMQTIDEITYTEQTNNTSYGRLPNGGEEWEVFEVPTPNALNEIIVGASATIHHSDIRIFPTVVTEKLYIQTKNTADANYFVSIRDAYGREVFNSDVVSNTTNIIDVDFLTTGMYFVVVFDEDNVIVQKQKIVMASN